MFNNDNDNDDWGFNDSEETFLKKAEETKRKFYNDSDAKYELDEWKKEAEKKRLKELKKPTPKKRGRPRKDSNIMKARTDIKDKILTTEMNVKKGLSPKVLKALKESIIETIHKTIHGIHINGGDITKTYNKEYANPHTQDAYNKIINAYLNNKDMEEKEAGKAFYKSIRERDALLKKKKPKAKKIIKGKGFKPMIL